jgi:hypothetical protein
MFDLTTPHGLLRAAHIIPGFIGLTAFWIPIFAKQGGRIHICFGWIFVVCAAIVMVTAMASSAWALIDPASFTNRESLSADDAAQTRFFMSFLGTIAAFTLGQLWLGVRVIRTRKSHEKLRGSLTGPLIGLQMLAGLGLFGFGLWWNYEYGWSYFPGVMIGIAAVALYGTWGNYQFVRRPPQSKMEWWYQHMQYMLATGIAFHTAFLVFGLNRYIGEYLQGAWAFVPWIVPTVIGVPSIAIWVRYYRRRFKDI